MNKEFIPYEQALSMEKLGFVERCFGFYTLEGYYFPNTTPLNSLTLPRSLTFGAVVGGSFLVADMIAPDMTNMKHNGNTTFFSAKTIEHRLIELSLGGGTALAANRFIFNASTSDLMTQAAIVGAANILGEYVADYMTSQPLSYFA
jgi:hypothetical protein